MIVRKIIDSTDSADNTDPEVSCNLATDDMAIVYEAGGGSSTGMTLTIYGRLPDTSATVAVGTTDTFDTTEWVQIAQDTNLNRGQRKKFDIPHGWPAIAAHFTGNSGSSRIRVWLAYNDIGEGL